VLHEKCLNAACLRVAVAANPRKVGDGGKLPSKVQYDERTASVQKIGRRVGYGDLLID